MRRPKSIDEVTWFWTRVQKTRTCWLWTAGHKTLNGQKTYGCLRFYGRTAMAHRVAYELVNGSIPEGLELDHLCRNKSCVNPKHLDAVDHKTNLLRGDAPSAKYARRTKCLNGHPLKEANGRRICAECSRAYHRNYRKKNLEKVRAYHREYYHAR